jgi:thiamine biosynthesis protein ThiS
VKVTFTLNGEPREVASGTGLVEVLESLGIDARRIAVERNREVVPRARHAEVLIAEGDAFEVVHFVGGG